MVTIMLSPSRVAVSVTAVGSAWLNSSSVSGVGSLAGAVVTGAAWATSPAPAVLLATTLKMIVLSAGRFVIVAVVPLTEVPKFSPSIVYRTV